MRVEFAGSAEQINPENDNFDVFVHLDDGRVYSFLVATPNNIYSCMENEGLDYYFGVPPVFVKRLTVENVERALRAILESGDEALNRHGSLQSVEEDHERHDQD
jgi:hypothetical protein